MGRNIIFDLGGVLIDLCKQPCIDAFSNIGCATIGEYVEDHRTEDLFLDIELGRISTKGFCDEARRLAGCEATDADIVGAWNALLGETSKEKVDRLKELARHHRLFLLSNTNEMHWECFCNRLHDRYSLDARELFRDIFLSFELGMKKPEERMFSYVLQQGGMEAADTVFVDDSALNCQAAERLGIASIVETTGISWITDKRLDL